MKYPILVFLLISFAAPAFSQKITGTVKNDQGKPLPSANVILHQATDSSVSKIAITNSSGIYEFTS